MIPLIPLYDNGNPVGGFDPCTAELVTRWEDRQFPVAEHLYRLDPGRYVLYVEDYEEEYRTGVTGPGRLLTPGQALAWLCAHGVDVPDDLATLLRPESATAEAVLSVTDDDVAILTVLKQHHPQTVLQVELGSATGLARATVGKRLKDLEKVGLVHRRSPRTGVSITPKGLSLLQTPGDN
jgi:hypothetical protein